MTKHIIDTVRNTTLSAKTAGDTWIVAGTGEINTPDTGIDASGPAAGRQIVVNGTVFGQDYGILFGKPGGAGGGDISIGINGEVGSNDKAIFAYGNGQTVTNKGTVYGVDGIYVRGKNAVVTNDGLIDTSNSGIVIERGSARIVNTGNIASEGGIWAPGHLGGGATSVLVINSGSVTGSKVGIELVSDGRHEIRNTGTVSSDILMGDRVDVLRNGGSGVLKDGEIDMGDGNDRVVNTGEILEKLSMGAGRDVADLRGSKATGEIYGEAGNDTYLIDDAAIQVFENTDEGRDTIKTTVNLSLASNFHGEIENLIALGGKNIDLTGNALANHVTGNAGKNRIDGDQGNDVLRGAGAADTFVFKTGHDHDKIMDFADGIDRIDVSGWTGIDNFYDVKAALSVHGHDLVLTSGTDILTLHDMKKADLDASDFVF